MGEDNRLPSPTTTSAHVTTETPTVPVSKRLMCLQYNKDIPEDSKVCPYCGINLEEGRVKEAIIAGVAAGGGIIGIHGLGHMAMGQIAKGFTLLFEGLILIAGIIISIVMAIDLWENIYIIVAAILGITYAAFFAWQVIDATTTAKKHNLNLKNHRVQ